MNGNVWPHLSPRETQVVTLSCRGITYDEIARQLGIAAPTVRTHMSRAMIKCGARTLAQLGSLASDGADVTDDADRQSGSPAVRQSGSESLAPVL
jgi:DNA-binding CsgD family transcriptional regulator